MITLVLPALIIQNRSAPAKENIEKDLDEEMTTSSAESSDPSPQPTELPVGGKSADAIKKPKMSAADFRIYNRNAVRMDMFHNHFRNTWNVLYKACATSTRPAGVSIRTFLSHALNLCHGLTMHHTIEEQHIFPNLAERMPEFKPTETLIQQHAEIHQGIEKLEAYVTACLDGEKELRMDTIKTIMDSFGQVLWTHLDLEVKMLGAENMSKYWTKDEILAMNW